MPDDTSGIEIIDAFRGEYEFLSNFHREAGFCVENRYQATKTTDLGVRARFERMTPGEAKRFGRTVVLREGWESMKLRIMRGLVQQKFERSSRLRALLLATGDALLIEGNYWHDNTWGDCRFSRRWWTVSSRALAAGKPLPPVEPCPKCLNVRGKNLLGQMLMAVRSELAMADERKEQERRASLARMSRIAREAGDYGSNGNDDVRRALDDLTALGEELGEYS